MDELDLTISLFVAPVFEAEKPCEPEPVDGGAWLSSEITKWQDDDILRSCPCILCPSKGHGDSSAAVETFKTLRLHKNWLDHWRCTPTLLFPRAGEILSSFQRNLNLNLKEILSSFWRNLNLNKWNLKDIADLWWRGAGRCRGRCRSFSAIWIACKYILECLQTYFRLSANLFLTVCKYNWTDGPNKKLFWTGQINFGVPVKTFKY